MPPKFKRKSSSTTSGSVKKKSKLKLFKPIPENDTVDKILESDDEEAQSSNSETKEKQLENDTTTDESSESDADGENLGSDDEDQNAESDTDGENLGSDDEDQSSESDPEDNNNCGKCVAKTKKFQRLKLLNEEAKLKLECLEESYYSMEDDDEGSENYVEWFGLRSKIHDLEIANDESKTKLETEAASAKKALENSMAEATVELQKVKNQLQTEVASKKSLEESLAKYQKLKQLLATKIFQTNPSNEDLIALLNLEIEELFKRYDQIIRFNKSDRFKVKEEVDCTAKDKKLDLQILQRELYEKELGGIMDVLKMPSGDRIYTNILPVIKNLLEQVDTEHYTNAVENLIN